MIAVVLIVVILLALFYILDTYEKTIAMYVGKL